MTFERRRNFNSRRRERTNFGDRKRIEVNWDRMVTGPFESVSTTLRRKLSQYRRHYKSFKIGITGDPNSRARGYPDLYDRMNVLYKTSSRDYVKLMESKMVDEYRQYCDNSIAGGGGPVAGPPYYLYIVI